MKLTKIKVVLGLALAFTFFFMAVPIAHAEAYNYKSTIETIEGGYKKLIDNKNSYTPESWNKVEGILNNIEKEINTGLDAKNSDELDNILSSLELCESTLKNTNKEDIILVITIISVPILMIVLAAFINKSNNDDNEEVI